MKPAAFDVARSEINNIFGRPCILVQCTVYAVVFFPLQRVNLLSHLAEK